MSKLISPKDITYTWKLNPSFENQPMQKTREERRAAFVEYGKKLYRPYQHMLDLDDEFPTVEIYGPRCISAEVGPGWVNLLRPAMEALRDLGGKVGQIKQKFGGLRFYWDPPEDLRLQYGTWYLAGKQGASPYETSAAYQKCDAAVNLAETLSLRTCEMCGVDLGEPRSPCHQVLCSTCATHK